MAGSRRIWVLPPPHPAPEDHPKPAQRRSADTPPTPTGFFSALLAANWAVVPGQRCASDGSWEWVWGESVTTGVRVSARCCVRATIVIVGFHDPPVGHRLPPVM
jgi:hypothetical protein